MKWSVCEVDDELSPGGVVIIRARYWLNLSLAFSYPRHNNEQTSIGETKQFLQGLDRVHIGVCLSCLYMHACCVRIVWLSTVSLLVCQTFTLLFWSNNLQLCCRFKCDCQYWIQTLLSLLFFRPEPRRRYRSPVWFGFLGKTVFTQEHKTYPQRVCTTVEIALHWEQNYSILFT